MANKVVAKIITIESVDPQAALDAALILANISADRFLGAVTIKLKSTNEQAEVLILYDDTP